MKKTILCLSLITMLSCTAQTPNETMEKEVKITLNGYLEAGDKNDVNALEPFLNDNFRVAVFDLEKEATSILDKETYTSFIKDKKFGGYTRTTDYHSIAFIGQNMATVQITLTSEGKPTLKNFYTLVKDKSGWTVLQDFVTLVK